MNDKTVTVKVPFSWIDTMVKVIPERLFKDVILGVLLHDDEKRCDPVFTTDEDQAIFELALALYDAEIHIRDIREICDPIFIGKHSND